MTTTATAITQGRTRLLGRRFPTVAARVASTSSRPEPKRSLGSLASASAKNSSQAAGSSGRNSVGRGGGSLRCAKTTESSLSRSNGFAPTRHSKRTQPSEYRSAAGPTVPLPWNVSGAA